MAPWLVWTLCYAAGLALTLALASRLTPSAWWRRPTLRGLCIAAGGAWACGSALAWAVAPDAPPTTLQDRLRDTRTRPDTPARQPGIAPAPEAMPPAPACQSPAAAPCEPFRVHRKLNLRSGPGVDAARLATLPAGALLTPTGRRSGDWWQVRAQAAAIDMTGWVSSLWLRQRRE